MGNEPAFQLETERLRLRPYTTNDIDDLLQILGDPETMTYYPEPYSREGTLGWIEATCDGIRWTVSGCGPWN